MSRPLILAVLLLSPAVRADEEEAPPAEAVHETAAEAPAETALPVPAGAGIRSSSQDAKPGSRPAAGSTSAGGGGAAGSSAPRLGAKSAPKGCEIRPAYARCGSSVANCPKYVQEPGAMVAYKVPASYFAVGPDDAARVVVHTNGGGQMMVSASNAPCAFTCGGVHDGPLTVLPPNSKKRKTPSSCQLGKGDVYVNVLFTSPCPLKGGCTYMIWQ